MKSVKTPTLSEHLFGDTSENSSIRNCLDEICKDIFENSYTIDNLISETDLQNGNSVLFFVVNGGEKSMLSLAVRNSIDRNPDSKLYKKSNEVMFLVTMANVRYHGDLSIFNFKSEMDKEFNYEDFKQFIRNEFQKAGVL